MNETGQCVTTDRQEPKLLSGNNILSDARVSCSIARPSENSKSFRAFSVKGQAYV